MGSWRTHRRRTLPAPEAEALTVVADATGNAVPENSVAPALETVEATPAVAVATGSTTGEGQPCISDPIEAITAGSASESQEKDDDDAALLQPESPPDQQQQLLPREVPQLVSQEKALLDRVRLQEQQHQGRDVERGCRAGEARYDAEQQLLQQQLLQQQLFQQQLLQQQQLIQQQLLLSLQQKDCSQSSQGAQIEPAAQLRLPLSTGFTMQSAQLQQTQPNDSEEQRRQQQLFQMQQTWSVGIPQKIQQVDTENAANHSDASSQLLRPVPFKVVYCSSFDHPYHPENLLLTGSADTLGRSTRSDNASQGRGKGWSSAPDCAYPQEIGFAAQGLYCLKSFQLLVHECRIPRTAELWVASSNGLLPSIGNGVPGTDQQAPNGDAFTQSAAVSSTFTHSELATAYKKASFRLISQLPFSPNEASRHRARELKNVNFPGPVPCVFLRLLISSPYPNATLNPANQVGFIAVKCLGVPADRLGPCLSVASPRGLSWKTPADDRNMLSNACCRTGPRAQRSSEGGAVVEQWDKNTRQQHQRRLLAQVPRQQPKGHGAKEQRPPKIRLSAFIQEQLELLHLAKKKFVEEELFCAALRVREALEKLERAKPRVADLEAQKDAAAAKEDFKEAALLKRKLFGAELCIKNMVAAALQAAGDEGPLHETDPEGEKLLREGAVTVFEEQELLWARPGSGTLSRGDPPLQDTKSGSGIVLQCRTDSFADLPADDRLQQQRLLDDRPIRGMRSHAFPPETAEASPVQAEESELPEVENLLPEDTKDASLLMPFFSMAVVRCLFSSQVQARCAAHEIVVKQLHAQTGGVSGDLFAALCVILRRAFRDKVLKVFLAGSQILSHVMEEQGLQPRHYLSPPFKAVMHELLLRVADVTSERAKKLLFQLSCCRPETKDEIAREVYDRIVASYPRSALAGAAAGTAGAAGALNHATAVGTTGVKGSGNNTTNAAPPVSAAAATTAGAAPAAAAAQQHKSVAQLVQLLVDLLSAHVIVQPLSPTGLELQNLLHLLASLFQSPSADIRGAAVQLSARLLSLPHAATQKEVRRFIETLRPKQRELVEVEFERLSQTIQQPATSSHSTAKSPRHDVRDQASHLSKDDRKPSAPAPPEPACEFCLKQSADFNATGLERHFLLKCPMLAPCPHCLNIVEVSHLWDHFLAECSQTTAYVRCETCSATMLKTQMCKHKEQSCKVAPTPEHRQCYFCQEVLPPARRDWRQHLLHECPNNPRAAPVQIS